MQLTQGGAGFNTAAEGGREQMALLFLFVFAIKRINCKHLCRRNERLPVSSRHFTLDSQAHFSHKHCFLFSKHCGGRLAECFYRLPLPVLLLFLKHDFKKKKKF